MDLLLYALTKKKQSEWKYTDTSVKKKFLVQCGQ